MNFQEFVQTIRTGQLSVDEIGRGMHKSFKNAAELIADAELLLKQRPARAMSLAVLAVEEIAKVGLLTNAAVRARNSTISWADIQKEHDLQSHRHKQTVFAAYGQAILDKMGAITGKDNSYKQTVPSGIEPLLDYMKQLGFYVDVSDGQFISPSKFGSDNLEWSEWLISVAKERLRSFNLLHKTEEKSIEVARKAGEFALIISEDLDEEQLKQKIREFIKRNQALRGVSPP